MKIIKILEQSPHLKSTHRLSGGHNVGGDLGRQGGSKGGGKADVEVGEEEDPGHDGVGQGVEGGHGAARHEGEDGNGKECKRQERGKDVSHLIICDGATIYFVARNKPKLTIPSAFCLAPPTSRGSSPDFFSAVMIPN